MTSLLTFRFNPPLSSPPIVTGISVLTTTDGGYTYTTTEQPTQIGGLNSNSNLRSVENIPTSVLSLNNLAFNGCVNLTSIILPSSITTIGPAALAGTSITKITIPSNVTSIGVLAFENCRNLSKITIPSTVTGINNNAFPGIANPANVYTSPLNNTNPVYTYFSTASNFSAGQVINISVAPPLTVYFDPPNGQSSFSVNGGTYLSSDGGATFSPAPGFTVTELSGINFGGLVDVQDIPNTVTRIVTNFSSTSLKTITIPASVTSISNTSFNSCTTLTGIFVDPSNPNYSSDANGVLYDKNKTILIQYPLANPLTSFTIPSSVTSLNQYSFRATKYLQNLTIGTGITTINSLAIYETNSIVSITIPNNVTIIESNSLEFCRGLTSINIPTSVTSIGAAAFYGNTAMTTITFSSPSSLTTIGTQAFQYSGLTSIDLPSSVTSIGSQAFSDTGIKSLVLNMPIIPSSAFAFLGLTSVTIGNNVTSINAQAFDNCGSLTSVTMGNSVKTIGSYAFRSCISLKSIIMQAGVTSISEYAFAGCTSLKQITIPSTVTNIGTMAFSNLSFPINVYTDNLDNSNAVYSYFTSNYTSSQFKISFVPLPIVPCFNKDTKILTTNGYVPIQDLRKGDLVKTINHEFVPINMIGCKTITNSKDEIPPNKLFVCSNENYPEITEDLYITGLHSILVDKLTQEQESNIFELFGKKFVTDGKYRLPVFMDKRANLYEESGEYTIYHIALDNENELMNYGIYANGLLVETCCMKYLKHLSNMTLIE